MIGTRPEIADETMRDCAELGIEHVWMHRGPGGGSVSETATAYGREHGIHDRPRCLTPIAAKVTLGFYAGLTDEGLDKAAAKLIEGGFGR